MHNNRYRLLGVLASLVLVSAVTAAPSNEVNPVQPHPAADSPSADRGILVKLRKSAAAAAHAQAAAIEARAKRVRGVQKVSSSAVNSTMQALAIRSNLTYTQSREITSGVHLLRVRSATGDSLETILARLRSDPDVEAADPNLRRYPHAATPPNDPVYSDQWYMKATQPAGTDAVTAWGTSTGRSDLVIADLDTGVRFDHPDLLAAASNGRLLPGYDFITDAAAANDGDGRDSDASDPGDWVTTADTQTSEFSGCSVSNSSWHGTRTAGILGALTNNAIGMAGMTWQPKILPVRILGKCGGLDSDILDGMRWASGLHVSGVPDNQYPAKVINLSLGSEGSCTSAQQAVINEVVSAGVSVVVSAGNDGSTVDAPANCFGVVAVAAVRNTGTKVGFSNLGPTVELSAPGGNCVNSSGACTYTIDTTYNTGTTTPAANSYTDQMNPNVGTSFSAPMVSGVAALMISVNANLKPAQIFTRLQQGTTPFPSNSSVPTCHVPASSSDTQTSECNCTTSTCGAGMLNAPGALAQAARPVAAITLPTTVASGQNVTISGANSGAACSHSIVSYAWTNVTNSNNAIQNANTSAATVVAPSSGSITIRLTVTDEAGKTDTADVTVNTTSATSSAPAAANTGSCTIQGITVRPATASLQANGGTQAFTAAVVNQSNTAVTWSVNGVAGGSVTNGTVSAAGVYTAPVSVPSPAVVTVTATSVAEMTESAAAQVTITPAVNISVTPVVANVPVSTTQSFTAAVANAASTSVDWSVNGVAGGNSTVGTISPAGVYSAPAAIPSPATVTVAATLQRDPTKSSSAQTTIVAAAVVTSSGTGSGSSTGSSTSTTSNSASNSSGGGAMDPVTLLGCLLATTLAMLRRRGAAPRL